MKVTPFDMWCPKWNQPTPALFFLASAQELQDHLIFSFPHRPEKPPSLLAVTHVGVPCNPRERVEMPLEYKMLQVIKFIRMVCHYFCIIIQLLKLWKVINHCTGDKLRN